MSLLPTAEKIVLSGTSTVPLHERFTIMLKSRPDQVAVGAYLQQKASFKNRKLVLQMEDRPSVLVALQQTRLKHRLGKANVLARLGQPTRAVSCGVAGRRFFMRELSDTSREGFLMRRVRRGAFKPGCNFRSMGLRHGWNSVARQKLHSALRMQSGLVTSSGQLVTHGNWYRTGKGRREAGLSLDQTGTRGHSGFDTGEGFGDWGVFNTRRGFATRGGFGARGDSGTRGGFRARGDSGTRGGFGARGDSGTRGGFRARGDSGTRGGFGARGDSGTRGGFRARGDSGTRGGFGARGDSGTRGGFGATGDSGTRGGFGARRGCVMRGSFRARVAFGARGLGNFRGPLGITKEQLDNELDEYMSMSKSNLDAQLDDYMSMAGAHYMDIK